MTAYDIEYLKKYIETLPRIRHGPTDHSFLNQVRTYIKKNGGGEINSSIDKFDDRSDPNIFYVVFFIWVSGSDLPESIDPCNLINFPGKIRNYFCLGRDYTVMLIKSNQNRELWEEMAFDIFLSKK